MFNLAVVGMAIVVLQQPREGDPKRLGVAVANAPSDAPRPAASAETMRLMREGSEYYLKQDFAKAIEPYSKALAFERRQRSIDQSLWRVLVDNLGMSYGITGDLQHAKETFEYGLSKDPEYPMFHYNLACTYAEMNDLDKALSNLRSAFQHQKNMIQGETFPDPATDDSFKRFLHDDRFVKALAEMRRAGQ